MTRLYEIAAEYRSQCDQLSQLDLPDDVVRDTLESIGGDLESKVAALVAVIADLEMTSATRQEAAKAQLVRANAESDRAAGLREYLQTCLELAGRDAVKFTDRPSVSFRKLPDRVEIDEGAPVPIEFLRLIPMRSEPDKPAILAALKSGVQIPGAQLITGRRRVEIK